MAKSLNNTVKLTSKLSALDGVVMYGVNNVNVDKVIRVVINKEKQASKQAPKTTNESENEFYNGL